jgi:hypothetical protein
MARAFTAFVDVDEDGDDDALGAAVVRNRRFEGPRDGIVRQYGTGTNGSSGAIPVLGASGPLRPGSITAALRFRRGLGGATAVLFFGTLEANDPGLIPGGSLYVQLPSNYFLATLGGAAGVPGEGQLTLDLSPLLPVLVGSTIYHQLVVIDPGSQLGGFCASNGLALTYGL